ncbi:MAG: M48 family metallopeptidase [Victivallales bacterium]|nr:M48 family metallopeptidase [Victivallales bacterium]
MQKFKVIKSGRTSIALHISDSGALTVRAPFSCSDDRIMEFVKSKKNWIEKKRMLVEKRQRLIARNRIAPGGVIPFLGDFYKINIDANIRKDVIFDNGFFLRKKDKIKTSLSEWYKLEALNIIPGITECEAYRFGLDVSKIKINSAETRWGSCTSKSNINFSWRLVALPEKIIHYVVIHELTHLIELNHSKKFWKNVEKLLPDYRDCDSWLKKNSFKYKIDL